MALHFKCSPVKLNEEQVLDYLYFLKVQRKSPSQSFFKHTIYGLRYAFRILEMDALRVAVPSIQRPKKLPVVLSHREVKLILKTPALLKHRIIIAMLYGCGLRCFELCNVELKDIDFDRKTLHIRQGKGSKDRYVPLPEILIRGLREYIQSDKPVRWCFNGITRNGAPGPMSSRGVQGIVRETVRKCSNIHKHVTPHSFRHSYATHLLEMGLDIMTIKDLLGHASIISTIVYLDIAQLSKQNGFSPLDRLYNK